MADDLLVGLRKKFKVWSTETTKEATKNLGKFKKLIKVSSRTEERGGQLSIKTTGENIAKDLKYGIKKVARAYEYGSGKWSRSKKKSPHQNAEGFIEIRPKKKRALAFFWETGGEYFPKNPPNKYLGKITKGKNAGKKMFLYVEHPGVQAANSGKGYIGPAFAKTHRKIRKELGPEVKKAVVGTFRKTFSNAK